ncbi:hypothetical protein KAR91_26585, partial [Candidatus Pacearchaeota archaeon]|nr:hypothetical protein [Candidatus Pacearchaeota archaeon]
MHLDMQLNIVQEVRDTIEKDNKCVFIPFREEKIPEANREWNEEPWDRLKPQGGFVTDFIYATRGIETTTKMAMWTALATLSATIRRKAWLEWFPRPLFPNLYMILVGDPRIFAKSTLLSMASEIIEEMPSHISDPVEQRVCTVRFVRNKSTPEALVVSMVPVRIQPRRADQSLGEPVDLGSQVLIFVPDLPTFMGKQKYNVGGIELLTDLYDCDKKWSTSTKSEGTITLRDVCITFMAAVTPDELGESVPEVASGGGFLSRAVLVYEETPTRNYAFSFCPEGAPVVGDLAQRLA